MLLGTVLGAFICDDTKKKITKAMQKKATQLSGCLKSSSEKAEEAIHTIKNAVKGLT